MKQCSVCKIDKDMEQFHRRVDSIDGYHAQCKKCRNAKIREYQKRNPEVLKTAKRKYYSSEKGRLQKKKEDVAYVLSGKRAESDKRRALKPISEARKVSKVVYALRKRSSSLKLSELDMFVLKEAIKLARLRKKTTKFDWHVDHIVPVSKNGTSEYYNIQVVPALWNRQKSNKHSDKYFG